MLTQDYFKCYGIYAIIDTKTDYYEALLDSQAVGLVQIRDKYASDEAIAAFAHRLRQAMKQRKNSHNYKIILNDKVELACRLGAGLIDGVHVGQNDMDAQEARRLLGPDAIIGLTVHHQTHIMQSWLTGLSYVSCGHIFQTNSKSLKGKPIGIEGAQKIIELVRSKKPDLPVCGIAGINEANVFDLARTAKNDFVAIIGAFNHLENPLAIKAKAKLINQLLQDGKHS